MGIKLSALPVAGALALTDKIPVVTGGVTKTTTITNLTGAVASVVPATDLTYDLGTNVLRFTNVYSSNVRAATAVISSNGSVGAPSYVFASDTTQGFYRKSAAIVSYALGGVDYWGIDANGPTLHGYGNALLLADAANAHLDLSGTQSAGNTAAVILKNAAVYTGAIGTTQIGVSFQHGINQTSTATFTSLKINQGLVIAGTGVPVFGSGGGLFCDFQSNSTSVFQVTSAGAVRASGTAALPTYSFIGVTDMGFSPSGTTQTHWSVGGVSKLGFIAFTGAIAGILSTGGAGTCLGFYAGQSSGATPLISLANGSSGTTALTGGAGIAQVGVSLAVALNQTSTASFTALKIATTETAVGSGAQSLIDCYAGSGGTTQKFCVTNNGGIGNAAVSPTALASGNTDDYAGIGTYGVARLTSNGAGSTLRGIVAPLDARHLTIVHIAGLTLTINNQDAGSAAANRIQTSTGAAVALAVNDTMTLWYDLTSGFWRQITTAA